MRDIVRFISLAGPWGPYHVAATDHGIVAAEWLTSEPAFRGSVAKRLGVPVEAAADAPPGDAAADRLVDAQPILESLLRGEPVDADRIEVDLRDRPAWDRLVLGAVRDVGFGTTASYGDIARRIGAPRAARAVGGALGRNPITLVIPCHRVIAADGTIGGYGGDGWGGHDERLALKRALLLREGVTVAERSV